MEPVIYTPKATTYGQVGNSSMMNVALKRKETFSSFDDALQIFSKKKSFSSW